MCEDRVLRAQEPYVAELLLLPEVPQALGQGILKRHLMLILIITLLSLDL